MVFRTPGGGVLANNIDESLFGGNGKWRTEKLGI